MRMATELEGPNGAQASARQAEIQQLTKDLEQARDTRTTLRSLRAFTGDASPGTKVRDAIQQIATARTALEQQSAELNKVQAQLEQLNANGLTAQELSAKLFAVDLGELPSKQELSVLMENAANSFKAAQDAGKNAERQLEETKRECEAMCARLSVEIVDDPEALVRKLRSKIADVEAAVGARQALETFMEIRSGFTAEQILANLSAAQELVTKLTTAVAQEHFNNSALETERKAVEDMTAKLRETNAKVSRLTDAEEVLRGLTSESSGNELTNRVLAENAQAIAATFASIHMPNEFDLQVRDGALSILRRRSGVPVELNQMSTGQRAAFALALFLAMNARLQGGPPVLLFDDPVAHVDDINVLSFLDHLRHLAIGGSRQIFFSTADTKLAGLFRHKFRFLGSDFREIPLSRE
jgi:DNA repair protein SbcC/Rad50